MKKINEIVIFNNMDFSETYNETRENLFETRADDFDWTCSDDVPEKMILDEMSFQEENDYQYFKDKFNELLKNGDCLLTGTCGRWNGPAQGGKFIQSFNDFATAIQHLDYLKIIDRNGHLIIEGYHHDGQDRYEIKQLTHKGYEYADSNYFSRSRKVHETIMKCNLYSRLPRLANL